MCGLGIHTKFSQDFDTEVSIQDVALSDYILNEWKLPCMAEILIDKQTSTSSSFLPTMTEKDLQRRSEIHKITKSVLKRSSVRQNMNQSAAKASIQSKDDDNESFKSFAMNLGDENQSEKSSIYRESMFMDAYGELEDSDLWTINLNSQHFTVIPILTMEQDEDSGAHTSILKDNIDKFISVNNDLIRVPQTQGTPIESGEYKNTTEQEIPLSDSEKHSVHSSSFHPPPMIHLSISRSIHNISSKKPLTLFDIALTTHKIMLQIAPFSIESLCHLLNPFEYFYNSSLDSDLASCKHFINKVLNTRPDLSKQSSSQSDQKAKETPSSTEIIISTQIKVASVTACLFLVSPDSAYFESSYEAYIGEFVDQNHFISQSDHIEAAQKGSKIMAFSMDMIERYLLSTKQITPDKYTQTVLDRHVL